MARRAADRSVVARACGFARIGEEDGKLGARREQGLTVIGRPGVPGAGMATNIARIAATVLGARSVSPF